jgi:hypothetical protein
LDDVPNLRDQELVLWAYLVDSSDVVHNILALYNSIEGDDLRMARIPVLEFEVHLLLNLNNIVINYNIKLVVSN